MLPPRPSFVVEDPDRRSGLRIDPVEPLLGSHPDRALARARLLPRDRPADLVRRARPSRAQLVNSPWPSRCVSPPPSSPIHSEPSRSTSAESAVSAGRPSRRPIRRQAPPCLKATPWTVGTSNWPRSSKFRAGPTRSTRAAPRRRARSAGEPRRRTKSRLTVRTQRRPAPSVCTSSIVSSVGRPRGRPNSTARPDSLRKSSPPRAKYRAPLVVHVDAGDRRLAAGVGFLVRLEVVGLARRRARGRCRRRRSRWRRRRCPGG